MSQTRVAHARAPQTKVRRRAPVVVVARPVLARPILPFSDSPPVAPPPRQPASVRQVVQEQVAHGARREVQRPHRSRQTREVRTRGVVHGGASRQVERHEVRGTASSGAVSGELRSTSTAPSRGRVSVVFLRRTRESFEGVGRQRDAPPQGQASQRRKLGHEVQTVEPVATLNLQVHQRVRREIEVEERPARQSPRGVGEEQ